MFWIGSQSMSQICMIVTIRYKQTLEVKSWKLCRFVQLKIIKKLSSLDWSIKLHGYSFKNRQKCPVKAIGEICLYLLSQIIYESFQVAAKNYYVRCCFQVWAKTCASVMGSGFASVGRAAASNTSGQQFKSSHQQIIQNICLLLIVKYMKIKKKRPDKGH